MGFSRHQQVPPPEPLREFRPGVWIKLSWLRFYGAIIQTRMIVVRIGEDLLLYSPTPAQPDAALIEELRALGTPRWLVAPNEIHNIGLVGFQAAFLEAHTTGCVGHPKRVPQARFDLLLDASTPTEEIPWITEGEVECHVIAGNSFLHEIAIFHVPSKTLIVTDAIEHFVDGGMTHLPLARPVRWIFERTGVRFNQVCMSPEHNLCCQSPDALQASMERLLSWDFEALVMCHGQILEGEVARRALRDAFTFNIERARRRGVVVRKVWSWLTRVG